MGPITILDKSVLQSFSYDEIFTLNRHYYLNITPILIIEILADLKKNIKKGTPQEKVKELASKLLPSFSDSVINVHYKDLLIN